MTLPLTFLTVDAMEAWRPDRNCIAAGDEYASFAVRSYAAAGLSDAAINRRVRLFSAKVDDPPERYDAAIAVARHAAFIGASPAQIVGWLASLAFEVPCWPDDPDEIAAMVRGALLEMGR